MSKNLKVQQVPASQVSVDQTNFTRISGVTLQLVLESIDDLISGSASLSADLSYLSGQIDVNTAHILVVAGASGNWDNVYANVNLLSGNWNSVFSTVQTLSSDWLVAGTIINVVGLSSNQGNISAYSDINMKGHSLYNIASASIYFDDGTVFSSDVVNKANSVYTTVNTSSAGWSETETAVQSNSGDWDNGSVLPTLSSNWENTSTVVQTNSATWDTHTDITLLAQTSAEWDDARTTVNLNSATWEQTLDITDVAQASGGWNSTETTVNTNSSDWDSGGVLPSLSGNWENTYTTVSANSAIWNQTADLTELQAASGGWNSTKTTVNTNSGNWDSLFSQVCAVSSLWARIDQSNTFSGDIIIGGSLTSQRLSAQDVEFVGSTVVTDVTSTGMFITLIVNGSALAIPLYEY